MPRGQRRIELVKRGRQITNVEKEDSSSISEVVGCPVLDPIQCQCPKDEIGPSEGVKMTCTWESCPFSNKPLHSICYQLLEDNLVRRLATLGSARGWTVPQRRNNLWERKGQALIGKFCRCRCDRGQMTRDKQALYEKERAVEKEKKKKAKKAKQLPQLQFNSKPSAAMEEKKKDVDVFHSPSAVSSHQHHTFSTTTRSRLHTDRTTSSMRTHTVGRTWSESSFAGETNGQYDNNEEPHPSDCECVFHHDYDADDIDNDHIDIDFAAEVHEPLEIIVPAPPPPPQSRSYAATIKSRESVFNKESGVSVQKSANSPDSGIEQPTPRLSFSSSTDGEEDNRQGDFQRFHSEGKDSESLNPLGLIILSPIEVSSLDENNCEEPSHFPELTFTPHVPKKREPIRAKKSTSVSKLPLAAPSQLPSEELPCGFNFNAPVREMMDIWHETTASLTSSRYDYNTKSKKDQNKVTIEYGWTPFFGRGFNLGERLYYFP